MRICDVNNFYSPLGGGVRVFHENRLRYFAAREDHAYALVVPSNRYRRTQVGHAVRFEVPALKIPRRVYRYVVSSRVLRRVIDDFRPDLVECGSPYIAPALVGRAVRGSGVPVTGFFHADYPRAYLGPGAAAIHRRLRTPAEHIGAWHVRHAYRNCKAVLCASAYAAERLRACGIPEPIVTPLGVDHEVFHPRGDSAAMRSRLGVPTDGYLVVHTARLHPEKSTRQLIRAWRNWRGSSDALLAIVAHGPLANLVRRELGNYPEVRVLEYQSDPGSLADLLACADLQLSLSAFDTFSLGTLESMAAGTPVLAVRGTAAAELVQACAGGTLIDGATPESILNGLHLAAAGPRSAASRRQLHERVAARYSWSRTFERQLDAYATMLGGRAATKSPASDLVAAEASGLLTSRDP